MSSATVKTAIQTKLIARARVSTTEDVYSAVPDLLDDALLEYAPAKGSDFSLLAPNEYELVLILGWIRICDSRASAAAPQASVKGMGGFGSDRDTPFYKNIKMAEELRKRYNELSASLAEGHDEGSGDITVGEFFRKDELIDAKVPTLSSPDLLAPVLAYREIVGFTAGGSTGGKVTLSWGPSLSEYFSAIIIFQSSAVGIYQDWNDDGTNEIPFINDAAAQIFETTDNVRRALKIQNIPAGTYYYMIVLRDIGGRFTYSNEVTVVIPA